MTRRKFLQVAAAAGAGAAIGGVSWGLLERSQLGVTRQTLQIDQLPEAFRGFRVALLTDFHRSGIVPAELIARAVQMTMAERPDAIVLGGDFITQFDRRFAGPVAEILSGLSAPAGVLAVLGNHDDEHAVPSELSHRGIRLLREDRLRLEMGGRALDFLGIDYWTRNAARIRALVDPVAFPVLVAHDPRRLSEAELMGIPLVLSGHTHGGQVPVPGIISAEQLGFPTLHGVLRRGPTTLFVSRGVGTIYLPVRINCPPEVALLTLA